MKLFALSILFKVDGDKVNKLYAAYDLSSFGYFQKTSVREFMDFTSKILVERTHIGQRASVKEQEYLCHVYLRGDGLSGVLISDHEYPSRVSFTLINKVLDEFTTRYPLQQWAGASDGSLTFPPSEEYLARYQNPQEADAMTKIHADLDDTKIILHNTIEAVLERGEKLDDLVEKSETLSGQSKAFYKTARKANRCCVIL